MEAWALCSSPAWGRLCALFVLAPTSKTEELLIASQGPPSFQGDRACSSLARVRWVGSYTHTHTHTHVCTHAHTRTHIPLIHWTPSKTCLETEAHMTTFQ